MCGVVKLLEKLLKNHFKTERADIDINVFKYFLQNNKNLTEKELKVELFKIINKKISLCNNCHLKNMENHTMVVTSTGNIHSPLMIVGEGPGHEEDQRGLPFEGKAGQLLNKILASFGLDRNDILITNVIKCRPPGNRNPSIEEIEACQSYLLLEFAVAKPKVIIALGSVSFNFFTQRGSIKENRGKLFQLDNGIFLIPTFHPAYLLRFEGTSQEKTEKWNVWRDFKTALIKLKELEPDFNFNLEK
jgi:DNA polymerase